MLCIRRKTRGLWETANEYITPHETSHDDTSMVEELQTSLHSHSIQGCLALKHGPHLVRGEESASRGAIAYDAQQCVAPIMKAAHRGHTASERNQR